MMWQKNWIAVVCLFALAACGGGGGQDTPSASATPGAQSPEPSASATLVLAAPAAVEKSPRIALEWTASPELTNFSVWLAANGSSDFTQIKSGLPGSARAAAVDRGTAWKLDFPTARIRVRGCDAGNQCIDSNEQPLLTALMGSVVTVVPGPDYRTPAPWYSIQSPARLSTDGDTLAVQRSSNTSQQLRIYHRGENRLWQPEGTLDLQGQSDLLSELELSGDGNTAVIKTKNGGPVVVF